MLQPISRSVTAAIAAADAADAVANANPIVTDGNMRPVHQLLMTPKHSAKRPRLPSNKGAAGKFRAALRSRTWTVRQLRSFLDLFARIHISEHGTPRCVTHSTYCMLIGSYVQGC